MGMLKISDAATLGLHAMAYLAQRPDSRSANRDIAGALNASQAHLAKVMQRLEHAGLVNSLRGPAGGFQLAKPAEKVTLKTIYEVIEGPLASTHCLLGQPICNGQCPLGDLVHGIDRQVAERVAGTRLSEFTAKCGLPGPEKTKKGGLR